MDRGRDFYDAPKETRSAARRELSRKLYGNKTLRGIFGSVFLITLIGRLIYRECGPPSNSYYGYVLLRSRDDSY